MWLPGIARLGDVAQNSSLIFFCGCAVGIGVRCIRSDLQHKKSSSSSSSVGADTDTAASTPAKAGTAADYDGDVSMQDILSPVTAEASAPFLNTTAV